MTNAIQAAQTGKGDQPAYKLLPVINTDQCVGCGTCVRTCQQHCLELVWDFSNLLRPEDCLSCGACAAACPHRLIRMDWVQQASGATAVGRWRATPPQRPPSPTRSNWLAQVFRKRENPG